MKQKVVIFGTGTTADVSHYYLTHDSAYEVVGFTVDGRYIAAATHLGLPVVAFEKIESAFPPSEIGMLIAISYVNVNSVRAEKYEQARAKGYKLISYVSSRAITWPDLTIGDNCDIQAGSIIQPFAKIGSNVVIASGSLISHHSIIGDHCFIAANVMVCGNSRVEPFCFIGANATIRDGITVARGCVIGAGALVLENTQAGCVYKGPPSVRLPKASHELQGI
ncbi:MAG TPA: acetyltransferase [Verrucomicrobiae bacterium]|nr:acetyltransferase [Verrucomicrobiae bacterium]